MNYLAQKSYLALKPEITAGTAVKPTVFVPLVSESVRTLLNLGPDRRMKGLDWQSDDLLPADRKHEGDIVILADADNIGHLFNMTYEKGTTTGDSDGYTHPFTVGDPKSYTLEIQKGPYAQRYFGVLADSLRLEFVDQKLQATASIKAQGQFSVSTVKAGLSGAVTSLKLAHDYDLMPNRGLAVGDVLVVIGNSGTGVEVTLTAVDADGETVSFSSTSITADAGNRVYLKAQTPSYTGISEPLYLGNTLIGVGATSATAVSNAGAKATATPMYDLSIVFNNNLFDAPASGSKDPINLIPQVRGGEITTRRVFEDEDQHKNWLNVVKQAITMITQGQEISVAGTKESLTINFHNVKLMTNEEPLDVETLLFDSQTFQVLYDNTDGKALEISLVNKTAGTAY